MEFTPSIDASDIADLQRRVRATRWPPAATDDRQGASLGRVRALAERWCSTYDWDRYTRRLAALPQVRTPIDGLEHHAIHLRSSRPDAVPLLVGHGWPSTCFEFDRVAPLLAEPDDGGPAFHVVAPSLPGYGFSEVPSEAGWNATRTASAWSELMARLGYSRYVVHGGDWGAIVATELALQHPEQVSGLHLTMPLARVTDADRAGATPREAETLARQDEYRRSGFAYAVVQMTRPQTLGYGLEDSPVGLLAWLAEKLDAWSGFADGESLLDDDAVLDVVSTYWLTRTATSSARMYFESLRSDLDRTVTGVPTGCSVFRDEIISAPRSSVERRYGTLVHWRELDRGGHFPAAEVPDVLAAELRTFATALASRS